MRERRSYRALAAWGDGLRQLGMRFVPHHTLGEAIPDDLNQLAFRLVKRRVDGPTRRTRILGGLINEYRYAA